MNPTTTTTSPKPSRLDGLLKTFRTTSNPCSIRLLPAFLKPPVFRHILGGLGASTGVGLSSPEILNVLQTSHALGRVDAATANLQVMII